MLETDAQFATLFLASSRDLLLGQYWPRLRETVASLTDDQVWWRPNESSNSIGNLLLHLNGNVGQWLVATFSEHEDKRNRPAEFAAQGGGNSAGLLGELGATLHAAGAVLERLTVEELLASFEIQGYKVRGIDAVYHVVEHFSMHYGQILYIAKSLTARDLGFYKELNQTGRAS